MRFRTAIAAAVVALLAALLGPVAPAQAAKPRLLLLFTSAESGIVAGNALWGQKSIQWTGYVSKRPKGSRLITQTKVAGAWRSITTTDKSVRRTVARGRFFPVLGVHRYRIALLSKKGTVLAASKAWTSTGFATVPLARVLTTLPPSIGAQSTTIGGYPYPMLWRLDHEDRDPPGAANSWSIETGRCRSVRLVASASWYGPPGTTASSWLNVTWSPKPNLTLALDVAARATLGSGATTTAVTTLSSVTTSPRVPGAYSGMKPMAFAYQGSAGNPVTWSAGETVFGGVGLCSRVVR